MAERRMFAKSIVLSDAFLDMPLSARCLYFTLGMLADDDGFVGNPKSILRQCGATQDDMLILLQKRFLLSFESGVIVIKHWRINNYLQSDRHRETNYKEELRTLMLDENRAYTELKDGSTSQQTGCIQNVSKMYTQDSIDKISKDKNSVEEDVGKLNNIIENQNNNITYYGTYRNIPLTVEQLEELKSKCPQWEYYIERISEVSKKNNRTYDNPVVTMLKWYQEDKAQGKWTSVTNAPPSSPASYDLTGYTMQSIYKRPVYKKKEKKK